MDSKQELRAELEDAVGHPVDRATADRALSGHSRSRFATVISENELLIGITLAGAIVFGVVLAVFLDSWLFLVLAVLVHAAGTLVVTGLSVWMSTAVEKPDPRTVARLEEEGVSDPSRYSTTRSTSSSPAMTRAA